MLASIVELKKAEQWDEAIKIVGKNVGLLLDVGSPEEFRKLSVTGLYAQLVKTSQMATVWVPYKQIILIALLRDAGDYTSAKFPPLGGKHWYIKSLHLLLDAATHDELREYAHLAPTVEVLLTVLGDSPLPEKTRLLLTREYERKGVSVPVKAAIKAALEKQPIA